MDRRCLDCRDVPGSNCSVTFTAGSDRELLDVAMEHAVKAHGLQDTPENREKIQSGFRTGCCC